MGDGEAPAPALSSGTAVDQEEFASAGELQLGAGSRLSAEAPMGADSMLISGAELGAGSALSFSSMPEPSLSLSEGVTLGQSQLDSGGADINVDEQPAESPDCADSHLTVGSITELDC